jgi:tetratricopeptide (TPR) repeat protein
VHDLALASGERELAAEALSLLGDQHWTLGEIDLANKHTKEAFALVADAPPSRTKAHTRVGLANRLWISGQEEEGLALARKGLEEAERLGAEDVAANALRGIGTVRAAHGDEGGLDDLARSAELGEKLSDPLTMHQAYNNLANMHWHFGRIAEGARYLKLDREIQERFGLTPQSATMRWIQGEEVMLLEMSGAWKECLSAAREFLTEMGAGNHYLVGPVLLMSSSAHLAQGDVRAALADSQRAFELAREVKDPQALHAAMEIRARVLLLDGQGREAEEIVDELLSLRLQLNEWFVKDLPWLLLDLGREAEYLEPAKGMPATPWLQAGIAIAERDFVGAAAIYERIGAKGSEAVARLHAAEDAAGAGRRSEADAELAKARPFFEAQGAKPYLRRCEALLAAAS